VVGTSGSAILGSSGSNTLKGTSGSDIFAGGGQGDTFVFAANFGRDVIKDFTASGRTHDTIQFSKTVFDSFASVLSHATQVGQDVIISTGSDALTLKNTKLGALNSQDFHFA
jgi:Ca2+-binding RTX toxin-like protein